MTFGPAYDEVLDGERIGRQGEVIRELMLRREWLSLAEIEVATGYPQSSISAQLRHLRKKRFGGYDVQKNRRHGGTWEYRVRKGV